MKKGRGEKIKEEEEKNKETNKIFYFLNFISYFSN